MALFMFLVLEVLSSSCVYSFHEFFPGLSRAFYLSAALTLCSMLMCPSLEVVDLGILRPYYTAA